MFDRISFLDKLLFTKHLAIMVKAGIPIAEALESLTDQSKSPAFRKLVGNILSSIQNGQTLAKALKAQQNTFDDLYVSLVEVGEESGTLVASLEFLVVQMSKDYALRKKIQGAMLYPGLVFAATFIMGSFIALFILPQLVGFFESFDVELPITTKILLFVANLMQTSGLFIVGGTSLFIVFVLMVIRLPRVKPLWHRLVLKIPLFGRLLAYDQLARFARNFGVLIQSGVPIQESLEATTRALSNLQFRSDLVILGKSLSKGQSIAATLKANNFAEFPSLVGKMIDVGEKTGKLDETLLYLGDFYEDEIDNISKNLSVILEPVLLIIIGLVVGFVALAIITPIYQLTGSIHR